MNFLGSFLSAIKPRNDDDTVDRLNYYYTCVIILVLSITISAKQYVGAPIQCWVPAQFTGAWEQYAENYCFVQNTYWLPLTDHIPKREERDERQLGYYQWVPFILAMEAVFFYLPCIFWRQMNWQSGIDILSIIKMAGDTENIQGEARNKAVNTVTQHLEDSIALQQSFAKRGTNCWQRVGMQFARAKGTYVTCVYVITKILYIMNVIVQFFVMNEFLGMSDHMWGFQILYDLAHGREWEESGNFPRVTLCDFEVRVLGNLHRYTIQCVLMINMFNEKIFLFLWWWFVLVALATTVNMLYWITTTASHSRRLGFVERYLRVSKTDPQASAILNKFADEGLRPDGILVLRMVASHAGDLITTEIINKLWDNFRDEAAKKEKEKEKLLEAEANKMYLNYDDQHDFHLNSGNIGFIETLYDQPHKLPLVPNSIPKGTNGVSQRNVQATQEELDKLISQPQHTTSNV